MHAIVYFAFLLSLGKHFRSILFNDHSFHSYLNRACRAIEVCYFICRQTKQNTRKSRAIHKRNCMARRRKIKATVQTMLHPCKIRQHTNVENTDLFKNLQNMKRTLFSTQFLTPSCRGRGLVHVINYAWKWRRNMRHLPAARSISRFLLCSFVRALCARSAVRLGVCM